VLKRDYQGQNCSIARALEIVGERWTLLIVRDAFLGLRRFEEFQENLGIARNVLTDRLNRLVEEGIFERVRHSERPERYEYKLTAKGEACPRRGDRRRARPYVPPVPPEELPRAAERVAEQGEALVPDGIPVSSRIAEGHTPRHGATEARRGREPRLDLNHARVPVLIVHGELGAAEEEDPAGGES